MNLNKKTLVGLSLIIIIIALGLRVYRIDYLGVWGDEKISIRNSTGVKPMYLEKYEQDDGIIIFTYDDAWSKNKIKHVTESAIIRSNGNAIPYNIVLHFWIKLFGTSDFSVRFLSLIFGLGIIVIGAKLANTISHQRKNVFLITLLLLSLNFLLIRYSQEARSYSMSAFFCVLSTCFLYKFYYRSQNNSNKQLLYIISYGGFALLAFFSHFMSIGIFIGHFVFLILFLKDKQSWKQIIGFAGVALFVLTTFLILGGYDGIISMHNKSVTLTDNTDWAEPLTYHSLLTSTIQVVFYMFGNGIQFLGIQIRYLLPLLLICIILIIFAYKQFKFNQKNVSGFYFLMLPVIAQLFLGICLSIYSGSIAPLYSRFFVFSTPFAMIIAAISICYMIELAIKQKNYKYSIYFLIVIKTVILILSLPPLFFKEWFPEKRQEKNPYPIIATKIQNVINKQDTIYYGNISDAAVTNLYLNSSLANKQIVDIKWEDKILIKNNEKKVVVFDFADKERY